MKKNTSLIKNTGVITALLGGAIASCAGPTILAAVLGGIFTNILSNKIEKIKTKDIQKLFLSSNPLEPNNDLEKLIQKAMLWATDNICHAYKAYCLNDFQQKTLKKNQKKIIDLIDNLDKKQWQVSNEFINEIDNVSDNTNIINGLIAVQSEWHEINPDKPFPIYYETHFIENFKLCFSELLKDLENESALKAYKRNISTQIQKQLLIQDKKLDSLLKDNKTIKKQLAKIASSPIESFEQQYIVPEINIVLDDYLRPLHDDVQLLVGINGKVLVNLEEIKRETEIQTQKIDALDKKVKTSNKYKIVYPLILIPVVAFLAYFIYQNWQSEQPFALTVNVINGSKNKHLKFYDPKVRIVSGDVSDSGQAQKGKIVFGGLPGAIRNDSVRVIVETHGFKKVDTSIVGVRNLTLKLKRDDTYRWLIGKVKDFKSGNPIPKAKVVIREQLVTYTDSDGRFKLEIPESLQKEKQWIEITQTGYNPYTNNIIPNLDNIIPLEKKN